MSGELDRRPIVPDEVLREGEYRTDQPQAAVGIHPKLCVVRHMMPGLTMDYTPEQARKFAALLIKKADEVEQRERQREARKSKRIR